MPFFLVDGSNCLSLRLETIASQAAVQSQLSLKIEYNAGLVQDFDQFQRSSSQETWLEPRKGRSTCDDPDISQICFRIQKDNKAYCATSDKEVGEVTDELLIRFLRSLPGQGS